MTSSYRSVYRSPSVGVNTRPYAAYDSKLGQNISSPTRNTYNNVPSQRVSQRNIVPSVSTTRQTNNSYMMNNVKKGYDSPSNLLYDMHGINNQYKRTTSPTILTADDEGQGKGANIDGVYTKEDDPSMTSGAMGMWRMTRDGNSPVRVSHNTQGTEEYEANTNHYTLSSSNNTSKTSEENTFGNTLEFGRSTGRGSTPPLVNMSIDSALMGGLGTRVGELDQSASFSPIKSFTTSIGTVTRATISSSRVMTGTNSSSMAASSVSSICNQRNITSCSGMRTYRGPYENHNNLVPHLQLPIYERQITTTYTRENNTTTVKTETQSYHPSWITVVFDLDETLCNNRRPGKAALRPGCMEILRTLAAIRDDPDQNCYIELILWTASMECVARAVTDRLDPNGTIFNHYIFRDRRWYREMRYTKDLRLLGRDMSHVVIIENSPQSVYLNRRHAILVKDYVGGCGVRSHLFGYQSNSATSTNSPTDPSLYIVLQVLVDWATEVKKEGVKQLNLHFYDTKNPNKGVSVHSHDPVFVSLPGNLGIVEFLREHQYINYENEVVINATNRHLGMGSGTSMSQEKVPSHSVNNTLHTFNRPSTTSAVSSYISPSNMTYGDRMGLRR